MKKSTSIRVKIAILTSIFTIVPTLAVIAYTTITLQNTLRNEIVDSNQYQMQWANQLINDIYLRADSLFNNIQIYPDLNDNLELTASDSLQAQLESYNYTRDLLNVFYYSNSLFIDDLAITATKSGKSFSIRSSIALPNSSTDNPLPWEEVSMYFESSDNRVIVRRPIKRFEDRTTVGYISIRLKEAVSSQLFNILQIDQDSAVFVLDQDNRVLLKAGNIENEPQDYSKIVDGEDFQTLENSLVFSTSIRDGLLRIVKVVPLSVINNSTLRLFSIGLVFSLSFMVLAIYLSYLFSSRLTEPIISLANTMKNVDIDEFKLRKIDENNEIGLLENGYNLLMVRIRNLIDQEYKSEIELKNAQLKALQAQINPHFLYNTLQMMGGIALANNVQEIYSIANTMADMFRYSISGGSDLVSINDEIKHTENYLYIQKLRFQNRIQVDLFLDESISNVLIPKFTLQPLVENAFEHGLSKRTEGGKLVIGVKETKDHLEVTVWDNGEGMDEEQTESLMEQIRNHNPLVPGQNFGIGLKNVNARLRLLFSDDYKFEINSKPREFTEVKLSIIKNSEV
ncbi:MAG: sensor histidine kinase [Erysipelotrichaceae bacterium]|nr:sensor histidine kinase [Erysipelotrichaceae bacterium]